ncbi:hypothetical protein PCANC_27948, partial [Puccinia coronata f. sp. avenae]
MLTNSSSTTLRSHSSFHLAPPAISGIAKSSKLISSNHNPRNHHYILTIQSPRDTPPIKPLILDA